MFEHPKNLGESFEFPGLFLAFTWITTLLFKSAKLFYKNKKELLPKMYLSFSAKAFLFLLFLFKKFNSKI